MSLRFTASVFAAAAVLSVSSVASAQLLVPDSFRDRIMLFSHVDGSPIDLNYITNAQAGGVFQLAIEAQQVGDQIWVSDQNADSIFRFTLAGQPLGTVVGPADNLDNIRGFAVINNTLFVTNFGALNGAGGAGIRLFNATTGANLGTTTPPNVESAWDVIDWNNGAYVSDGGAITPVNTGHIFRLNRDTGAYESTLETGSATTNGLSLPKGMTTLANGNLLVANNSTPRNLYEYAPNGTRVASYGMGDLSVNGVFELENGRIFVAAQGTGVTGTNGLYSLDRATGQLDPILLGSQTPINPTTGFPEGFIPNFVNYAAIPEPAAAAGVALLAAGALAGRGRRTRAR